MPEDAENFLTDRILKAIGESHGYYHCCHTDNSRRRCQSYNETRKRTLLIESGAPGNEGGKIQEISLMFSVLNCLKL